VTPMADLCPHESSAPRASPFFTFRGNLYHRRAGFVLGSRLTCPLSHHVKRRAIIHESGAWWCTSKLGAHDECGAMLFVLVFPGLGKREYLYAADVEHEDLLTMERYRMDVGDMLSYLGAVMPQAALLRRA
jgi:hypothetical protein